MRMIKDLLESNEYKLKYGEGTIDFGYDRVSINCDIDEVFVYKLIIYFRKISLSPKEYNKTLRSHLDDGFKQGIHCFEHIHHSNELSLLENFDFECYNVSSELSTKGVEFEYRFNIKFKYIERVTNKHGFFKVSKKATVYNIIYGQFNECLRNN